MAPQMAQRMESVAPPGGMMLSESTARLVEGAVVLGDSELVHIKGADEPVCARRLLGESERHRTMVRAESNLVGRGWELAAVEGLLEPAIDGPRRRDRLSRIPGSLPQHSENLEFEGHIAWAEAMP